MEVIMYSVLKKELHWEEMMEKYVFIMNLIEKNYLNLILLMK